VFDMNKLNVLFYTVCGGKFGMGHFIRCLALALKGNNFIEGFFYLRKSGGSRKKLAGGRIPLPNNSRYINEIDDLEDVNLVVSDVRNTSPKEMRKLTKIAPVISFDDWGAGMDYAHVTIYPLPTLREISGNLFGLEYLILNPAVTATSPLSIKDKKGVLVCFGGSDPYNLSPVVARALNQIGIRPLVVAGPFSEINKDEFDGQLVRDFSILPELLNKSRLVITSFGITLFEAMYLQTPVILFNNTAYHNKLAEKFDVISLGYRNRKIIPKLPKLLERTIGGEDVLIERAEMNKKLIDGKAAERILELMKETAFSGRRRCLFNHQKYYSVKRGTKNTLFRCRKCGDLFNFLFDSEGDNYDSPSYFLSNYRAQYGKTYIADRENIERMAGLRLERIENILGRHGKLLDVGSALGFLVKVARDRGWDAEGVEISAYAVEWSRRRLGINVHRGSFFDVELDKDGYDVITFFYVLEHFKELDRVIEKVKSVLKSGGILAIAMPNRGGISFRFNRRDYLRDHPNDHYIDTTHRNLRKYLRNYGFGKFYTISTGIHPERFFSILRLNKLGLNEKRELLYRIYCTAAKKLNLGDTFELYAVKN